MLPDRSYGMMRDDASPMTNVSGMAETPDTAGKALEPRADLSHLASGVHNEVPTLMGC